MDNLQLLSLNVRGLKSDSKKRKRVFTNLKKKHTDIIMLQETHSTKEIENEWTKEWGGEIVFSHGTSKSRGVALLVTSQHNHNISNICADPDGRYIIVDIIKANTKYTLVNIYAPTQNFENEQISLIHNISNILTTRNTENIIMGGDFNIVLNPAQDKRGGNRNLTKSNNYRAELLAFIETLNLCDIWRVLNNEKFAYTWHCKKTKIFCRLDFWLIGEHLSNIIHKVDIQPSVNSDHDIISLAVKTPLQKRGPSYWKFNTSLLKDTEYINLTKRVIQESAKKHQHDNKNLMCELIKMEIRMATITYSKIKQKESNLQGKQFTA